MRATHRLTKHPLYRRWQDIKRRCRENPVKERRGYQHYGGKGIRICKEWESDFIAFYSWAIGNGFSKELCIDRIDSDKDYSPDNCRWVTVAINNRNTSKNIFVKGVCLKDYCELNGLRYKTVWARIKDYQWSVKDAISIPIISK